MNAVEKDVRSVVEAFQKEITDKRVYFLDEIPESKLEDSKVYFGISLEDEEPLVLLDCTQFCEELKYGAILTEERLIVREQKGALESIALEDISDVDLLKASCQTVLVVNGREVLHLTGVEESSLLVQMIRQIVSNDDAEIESLERSFSARTAVKQRKGEDEKFCESCGEVIKIKAVLCPHCMVPVSEKCDKGVLLLLTFFLGGFGAHKFYMRKSGQGYWNIGIMLCRLPSGDRFTQLKNAIDYYFESLKLTDKLKESEQYAKTQNNIGNAYLGQSKIFSGKERFNKLDDAINKLSIDPLEAARVKMESNEHKYPVEVQGQIC